jgi:hypothetical protein
MYLFSFLLFVCLACPWACLYLRTLAITTFPARVLAYQQLFFFIVHLHSSFQKKYRSYNITFLTPSFFGSFFLVFWCLFGQRTTPFCFSSLRTPLVAVWAVWFFFCKNCKMFSKLMTIMTVGIVTPTFLCISLSSQSSSRNLDK